MHRAKVDVDEQASTGSDVPGWTPTRAALVLGLLWGLSAIGTSATSVVLGPLGSALSLSTTATAWVLTSFALAFAASTAIFGRVADATGPRVPFLVGGIMLALGAAVAAAAGDLTVLIAGRTLQGLGAGAVPVLVTTILSTRFSGHDRTVALGRTNSVVVVLSSLGPLIGGLLGVLVGWRGPFALPVLALVLLPFAARLAPRRGTGARIDALGAGLVALTAGTLLVLVQTLGTPSWFTAAAGAALLPLVAAAVLHVRSHPDGFLPVRVVTDPTVVRAAVAGAGMPLVYFAGLVAVPLQLDALGWDPLQNGLLLLPGAVVGSAVSFNSAAVVARLGRRGTAVLGLSISTAGALAATGTALSPWLAGLGFLGLSSGYALAQPTLVGSVAAAVPEQLRGSALGVFTLVFFVGAGLGSAVVGGFAGVLTLPGALAVAVVGPVLGVLLLVTAPPSDAWRS